MKKKKGLWAMAMAFQLNNLLAIVMCLLIMTLFGFILNTSFGWIMYAIMPLIYAFLLYHQAWQYGSRDLDNRFGNRTTTALSAGVVATVPTVIMAVLSYLVAVGVYSPQFAITDQAAIVVVYRFWNMPFRLIFDYLNTAPVLYFIPCITMPVFVVIGYIFGHKQIKISDYIYYAREKNE